MFEKIVKKQLISFLEFNLLHHSQYGFRQGKVKDQAIANLTQFIYKSLDNNKKCATVYLNLAKAFDTVDHDILIIKLKQLGICGNNLKLFTSYLSNKKQYVKINKTISSLKIIKCGVLQGTVISPIFFNIQINRIHSLPLQSEIICYADDTVMLCKADSLEDIFKVINRDNKLIFII